MARNQILICILFCLFLGAASAHGQTYDSPGSVFHPNQEVRISIPREARRTADSEGTLIAALEGIFRNSELCCGEGSPLHDRIPNDATSLEATGTKLQGKAVLSNGRSITIKSDYLSSDLITADRIIAFLIDNQPLLLKWNSDIYVVYGVVFDEKVYETGHRDFVIRKLFLRDPRYSGVRGDAVFDRQRDGYKSLEGLLALRALPSER